MPRIIAGAAGGIQLGTSVGRCLRPTTDRVKESLFARLDSMNMLKGSSVLDLCAGSGALALEAVSRGARSADLVESNTANYRCLRENIGVVTEALGKADGHKRSDGFVRGYRFSALRFLQRMAGGTVWDLVFLDPPYSMPNQEITKYLKLLDGHVVDDGLIIVERGARDPSFPIPQAFVLYDLNFYGETALYWLEPA